MRKLLLFTILTLLTNIQLTACPVKFCFHLSRVIGRTVHPPVPGTVLSRAPNTFVDDQSKRLISVLEEYRFVDPHTLEVLHYDKERPHQGVLQNDLHCLDQVVPRDALVLGLISGNFPQIGSLVLGHRDFGLKELLIGKCSAEQALSFHHEALDLTRNK